jgi:hypothetical protein
VAAGAPLLGNIRPYQQQIPPLQRPTSGPIRKSPSGICLANFSAS